MILFWFKKIRSVFKNLKNMVFGDKNSDLCLLHKTKSFDLKISYLFLRTQKNGSWFIKDQICFVMIKNMVFDNRKVRSVFYMFKKYGKDFFLEENFTHNINLYIMN